MESIRAGTRLNLDLSGPASHFGIDWRKNHSDFANEIRIHFRGRIH